MNIYVAKPTNPIGFTGSYVGVETSDPGSTGSIQLRTSSVGCVYPITGESYSASDILQTTPPSISSPTYLASPGIQVGPGVDLVTKSAGNKPFSTYIYPTIIFYGLRGLIRDGRYNLTEPTGAWLWPGSQAVSNNITTGFPDPTVPSAFFRIQQPSLLSGLSASLVTAAGGTNSITLLVQYTPVGTTTLTNTVFTLTLSGAITNGTFYNSSLSLNTGDKLHVNLTYTGGNANNALDLSVQLDLF